MSASGNLQRISDLSESSNTNVISERVEIDNVIPEECIEEEENVEGRELSQDDLEGQVPVCAQTQSLPAAAEETNKVRHVLYAVPRTIPSEEA